MTFLILSSITTPPTSTSGFSFLSTSSSSSIISSASLALTFSPSQVHLPLPPSFSLSSSSTLGKLTTTNNSNGFAPSTAILSAGMSSSPTSSFLFANVTPSSRIQSSFKFAHNIKPVFLAITTINTTNVSTLATKGPSFPVFSLTYLSSATASRVFASLVASASVSSFVSTTTTAFIYWNIKFFFGFFDVHQNSQCSWPYVTAAINSCYILVWSLRVHRVMMINAMHPK